MSIDYLKFYDLEKYLFEDVGPRFRNGDGIFIWKANRAKTRVRDRLKQKAGTFEKAVAQIATSLSATTDEKERLRILMEDWALKLPMASAILTVLYDNHFTVYDIRVCKQLALEYRPDRDLTDALWTDYEKYREAVVKRTPSELQSLRDRDRFLWGANHYVSMRNVTARLENPARRPSPLSFILARPYRGFGASRHQNYHSDQHQHEW